MVTLQVVDAFIKSLRVSGQDHVANVFHRESDHVTMSEAHYQTLNRTTRELCEFLEPRDGLVDVLVRDHIFIESNRQSVLSRSSPGEMAREVVSTLQRRPDDAFAMFIAALRETNQPHVEFILTGNGSPPMSSEHRRTLQTATNKLCDCLDPENGVLTRLLEADVLTSHDVQRCRRPTEDVWKVYELVEILVRKPDHAFDDLISAVNYTGQSHVTQVLTGNSDRVPLAEEIRRQLTRSRSKLVKLIDSTWSGLVTELIERGVFSDYDRQRVMKGEKSDYDRSEMILDLIAKKSQWAFEQFIAALENTNQGHVVVELIGCDLEARVLTNQTVGEEVEGTLRQLMHEVLVTETKQTETGEALAANGVSIAAVNLGSIVIVFRCTDIESLDNLKELYRSETLDALLMRDFCPQFTERGLEWVRLRVEEKEFERCQNRFEELKPMSVKHRQALESAAELFNSEIQVYVIEPSCFSYNLTAITVLDLIQSEIALFDPPTPKTPP